MSIRRSPAMETGVRMATPLALAVGLYLLFAGHNNPGGGVAAGRVFGTVVVLRTVAGMQQPRYWVELISGGILIVAAVAIAPLVFGNDPLDMVVVSQELPVLGKVKSGSAFIFDIGVTAIVVGLALALLDSLWSEELEDEAADQAPLADGDDLSDNGTGELSAAVGSKASASSTANPGRRSTDADADVARATENDNDPDRTETVEVGS
ncbi:MAG: MnhB domain-containing protein [Actinomycetota bacterium]